MDLTPSCLLPLSSRRGLGRWLLPLLAVVGLDGASALAGPNPPAAPATEPSSGGGWLKWVIIAVVVFGVIRLIGFLLSRNQAAGAPGSATPVPGAFGGGFMSSLLGGLFGAMAGHWLYDKFFSDHEDRSYHATDSRPDNNDWRGDDHGDLGSGSGGDWGGDDSSGGDSGGGDW